MTDTCFTYRLKNELTTDNLFNLGKDIKQANEESRKMWKRLHKVMNSRVVRYTVGWTQFVKHIALNSEYMSNNDIILGVNFTDSPTHIKIYIDETFMSLIEFGESLGVTQVRKAINQIKSKLGMEDTFDPETFTKSGFSKYCIKALADNGIEVELQ